MAISELQREGNERKRGLRAFRKNYLKPLLTLSEKLDRQVRNILSRKRGLPGTDDLRQILSNQQAVTQAHTALIKGVTLLGDIFAI
jgi:hypothetical protein